MRALLSAVGTRGDVQPMLAVAVALRKLGHEARLAIPPNFVQWAGELGFEAHAVGIEMRPPPPGAPPPKIPDLITDQFVKVGAAADGCDVILGGNAHQYAARSIAELRGIPFFDALYAPVALPSDALAPPPAPGQAWEPGRPEENRRRWDENRKAWNGRALERVNANRARLGLKAIDDVLQHVLSDRPWLAADATLAPASGVLQTGAWILEDRAPLPPELEAFLVAGEPPIYFGFGSMPTRPELGALVIAAARAVGRRAIVSKGWGGFEAEGALAIGDVNQQALFPRVAAVVHHGGAGTTTTAARAGAPQVVTAMFSDQFYWGHRVQALGLGASLPHAQLSADGLAAALRETVTAATATRAKEVAAKVTTDGARVAARALVAECG
jgi:vancomycin aglycone glucosyltransferase